MKKTFLSIALMFAAFLSQFAMPYSINAQVSPGPHEILPYEDGFIVE
ncbi:MAG: hypothetical protein JWQ71_718, partial [Pedosphaera sp.]|nr:hypothetical protein [Pedosphaera sp.]